MRVLLSIERVRTRLVRETQGRAWRYALSDALDYWQATFSERDGTHSDSADILIASNLQKSCFDHGRAFGGAACGARFKRVLVPLASRSQERSLSFTTMQRAIPMQANIAIGYQAYVSDDPEEFGAIRYVSPERREVTVYVENKGEFVVPGNAIEAVHDQKVIFDCAKLDRRLREAIGHAHDSEEPGF